MEDVVFSQIQKAINNLEKDVINFFFGVRLALSADSLLIKVTPVAVLLEEIKVILRLQMLRMDLH